LGPVVSVVAGSGRGDQVHVVLEHAEGRSSTMSLSLTVPPAAIATSVYVYGQAGRETAPATTGAALAAHSAALSALIEQANSPAPRHPCDVHFGARVVDVLAAAEQSLHTG